MIRRSLIPQLQVLTAGVLLAPVFLPAQQSSSAPNIVTTPSPGAEEGGAPAQGGDNNQADLPGSEAAPGDLPVPVSRDHFAALMENSPFLRPLNPSSQLILTGLARIEEETIATVLDLDTGATHLVSGKTNSEGWQLMEVKGDHSDIKSLTAHIRLAGAGVVPIHYQEAPPPGSIGTHGVRVSNQIGNGTPGGGTGPHGGPDPGVLTPDQLADARRAARNIRDGFQADGYGDRETIPPEVISKIAQLSTAQREAINVKMFEYRNRGLGMQERKQIYNNLLDRAIRR